MSPEQWIALVQTGGAVVVLLGIVWAAKRGDIRFKPGVDGELRAKDDALADARAQRDRLVAAVEQLGDALEARNRRDERVRREQS